MKYFHSFFCMTLSLCLALSSFSPVYGAQRQNAAELYRLRDRARAALAINPNQAAYIRQLLTLTAGVVTLEVLATAASARTAEAIAATHQHIRFSSPRPADAAGVKRHLFAKRRSGVELTGSLFDQPEASAPAAKPAADKDLSWLDEPRKPVAPKPKEPTLFGEPAAEIKPKTQLSQRIMKNYQPRISRLPLSEQQGLIEALDEAVMRKRTAGRQNAIKFLEQKAFQSSTTSLYFIIAKRMLLLAGVLAATDLFVQSSSQEKMLLRLTQNPVLFLDATDQQLEELARNPQAATYCRRITEAVERLAYTPLTAQEQAFLSEQLPQQPMLSPFLMAR